MDPSDICQFIRLLLINLISDFQLSLKAEPKEFILTLSVISDNDWNHQLCTLTHAEWELVSSFKPWMPTSNALANPRSIPQLWTLPQLTEGDMM